MSTLKVYKTGLYEQQLYLGPSVPKQSLYFFFSFRNRFFSIYQYWFLLQQVLELGNCIRCLTWVQIKHKKTQWSIYFLSFYTDLVPFSFSHYFLYFI